MNKSRRGHSVAWALGFAALLAFGSVEAGAQDNNAACTLRGRDSVLSNGATVKACLDLTGLDNQTVVIPKNVTRIDSRGFALCETSESRGGLADIVYVMDQSGSMALSNVWVSPDARDTVYLNSGVQLRRVLRRRPTEQLRDHDRRVPGRDAHGEQDQSRQGSARQQPLHRLLVRRSVQPARHRLPGAIDYQAQRAPDSRAGYLGFAGGLEGTVSPRQLNTPANIAAVKQPIDIRNRSNTNYTVSLTQAKQWLNTPALSPNPTKAIIFLSDGKPTGPSSNPQAYLSLIDSNMPPVYGIFLGVPRVDTLLLSEVSRAHRRQVLPHPAESPRQPAHRGGEHPEHHLPPIPAQ